MANRTELLPTFDTARALAALGRRDNSDVSDLRPGTVVSYDGRAQGVKIGQVQRREVVAPYRSGGTGSTYYQISTSDLLVPAQDILSTISREV